MMGDVLDRDELLLDLRRDLFEQGVLAHWLLLLLLCRRRLPERRATERLRGEPRSSDGRTAVRETVSGCARARYIEWVSMTHTQYRG